MRGLSEELTPVFSAAVAEDEFDEPSFPGVPSDSLSMNPLRRTTPSLAFVLVAWSTMGGAESRSVPFAVVGVAPDGPQVKTTPKQAIQDGLTWLARHQSADGSWSGKAFTTRCTPGKPCSIEDPENPSEPRYDEGLTGLAILCFLRAGFGGDPAHELVDPTNQQHYKTADVVTRGLDWLTKCQNEGGSFQHEHAFMYSQAIATIAMCEAALALKNDTWKASARHGVEFVVKAQRPRPEGPGSWGWRYEPRDEVERILASLPKGEGRGELSDADTSITAWCTAALAAGLRLGFDVKQASLDGALAFCDHVCAADGKVGYTDRVAAGQKIVGDGEEFDYHFAVMSALAISIRMDASKARTDPFVERALPHVLADLPRATSDKLSIDYYYWYQASRALNRLDGDRAGSIAKKKVAGPWNKALTDSLLSLQDRSTDRCAAGGWLVRDRWSAMGGVIYCTTMSVLALEACNPRSP